ncbi:MAG: ABC transporter ATP-binding protein [Ignavibacteriales bacterium]
MGGHGGLGMPVQKAKDFWGTLKRLLEYLRPRLLQLTTVFLFAILGTAFSILSPRVMGKATTRVFEGVMMKIQRVPGAAIDFGYVRNILLSLGGLYVLSALFTYIQHFLMAAVAQATVYEMRRDINVKMSRLPLRFFDSRTHGEILSRITNDVDNISNTLQQSLTQLITAATTVMGIVVMMLTISPALTLVALVMLPVSAWVTMFITRRSQRHFAGQQRILGELNGHVEEMYTGHRIVKAFGREEACVARFDEINDRLYEHGWKAQFISGVIMPLMAFINNTGYAIISVAGGLLVTRRAIELGDVQAFISYARHFSQPIVQTANIANIIQSAVASAERVFEILDEAEETPDAPGAKVIAAPRGDVIFHDVKFGYEQGVCLIKNMNIEAKRGQTIAIVGPTGAGKTTLVNLLMRFYEIADGRIAVDGVDIRDMTRGGLRTMFGMVLQDTWLFNGTIRENIAYGREGATDEEIVRAARAAIAHHFISALPDGYNTILNEDASNLSQGQMQLLTIARAILADPAILILDETTSSVDTRTEAQIQKAMRNLMRSRTSFVIAHRLSTIREADLILVMDNGMIVEQGKHTELMARRGFYADLYNSQFAGSNQVKQAV